MLIDYSHVNTGHILDPRMKKVEKILWKCSTLVSLCTIMQYGGKPLGGNISLSWPTMEMLNFPLITHLNAYSEGLLNRV